MRKHVAFRDGATGRRFILSREVGVERVFWWLWVWERMNTYKIHTKINRYA